MNFKHSLNGFARFCTQGRQDLIIGTVISLIFASMIVQVAKTVPQAVLKYDYFDVWYEGDLPKVYSNLTQGEDHKRIWRHPFFILLANPAVILIKKIFSVSDTEAVRALFGCLAFFWMLTLFSVLRLIGCKKFDTALFCALAGVSSASVFWLTVPETFSFGSWSILLALLVVALSQKRIVSPAWIVSMNLATIGFVISNFTAGILATLASRTFKRAAAILGVTLLIAVSLWGLQTYFYPKTASFTGKKIDPWEWNVVNPHSGTYKNVVASFFFHSLIMPEFHTTQKPGMDVTIMLTQLSNPGSATVWGAAAVALWAGLLFLGTVALVILKNNLKMRIILGILIAGQLFMHVLYGSETFLYSLHFVALLIPLAATASLTQFRKTVVILLLLLIPCVAVNNYIQFDSAKKFIRQQI